MAYAHAVSNLLMPSPMPATEGPHPAVRVRAHAFAEIVDTHTLVWSGPGHAGARNQAAARRAQPADFLLPVAKHWMASLPAPLRPRSLAQQFPRLANRFAAAWEDEPGLALVFSDLMIDHRGNRQGFPPAVKAELHRLWRHWHREREAA